MSNTWIAFPTTIYGSKKSLICAEILKVEQYSATGLIAGLYSWSSENADKNGLLENVSPAMLADALGWPKKKSAALIKALENAGIIEVLGERTMLVNGWYEIGGKLADAREKDAERKRTSRAAQQALSADCPPDVRRKSVATQHNTTVHNNISTDVDMYNGGEAALAPAHVRETPDTPDTEERASKTTRKEKKPTDSALIAEAVKNFADGDAEIEGLLNDWLAVRKAKRAPATIRAIELNLKKMHALASESNMTLVDYLEAVVARGWTAFYAIRDNGGYQTQRQFSKPAAENKGTLYGRTIDEMGYDDPINQALSLDLSFLEEDENVGNDGK